MEKRTFDGRMALLSSYVKGTFLGLGLAETHVFALPTRSRPDSRLTGWRHVVSVLFPPFHGHYRDVR
jgi:hypothetical protein